MPQPGISLRRARADDFPAIRSLIRRVHINPSGLDWRRFLIAVDGNDALVGCGQLKPHGPDVVELASIAVERTHRGQGIARRIIERLLEEAPRPLYLTARWNLGPFYARWGFQEIDLAEMPPYFRRLAWLARIVNALHILPGRLLVMVLK